MIKCVKDGWPQYEERKEMQPFFQRRCEFSVVDGCLLWGRRVVLPMGLRCGVLKALHEAHVGIVRMKALARSYVWWPGIDRDVEEVARSCKACGTIAKNPVQLFHSWEMPKRNWERIHIDFAGPFLGNFLRNIRKTNISPKMSIFS